MVNKIIRNPPSRPSNTVPVNKVQNPLTLNNKPLSGQEALKEAIKFITSEPISYVVENATVIEAFGPKNGSEKTKYKIDHLNLNNSDDYFSDYLLRIYDPKHDIGLINPRDEMLDYINKNTKSASSKFKDPKSKEMLIAKKRYYHQLVTNTKIFAPRQATGFFSSPPKIGDKVRIYYFQNPMISSGEPIAGFYEKMNDKVYEQDFADLLKLFTDLRQKLAKKFNNFLGTSNSNTPEAVTAEQASGEYEKLPEVPSVDLSDYDIDLKTLEPLRELIAKHESGKDPLIAYNAMNQGTVKNASGQQENYGKRTSGNTTSKDIIGKLLVDMTITEILAAQSIKTSDENASNRLGAAGRYQIISITMKTALKLAKIKEEDYANTKFDQNTQDKLCDALIKNRKKLYDYLRGLSNDRKAAMLDLAKEWRSFPDPNTGMTYSDSGSSVNKAFHSITDTANALDKIRKDINDSLPPESTDTNPPPQNPPEEEEESTESDSEQAAESEEQAASSSQTSTAQPNDEDDDSTLDETSDSETE